jgi:Domain of unknown function (DUF397)
MKRGVWIKSSYSAHNGNCLALKWTRGAVLVKDSKNPHGPVLAFTPAEWRAFLASLGR